MLGDIGGPDLSDQGFIGRRGLKVEIVIHQGSPHGDPPFSEYPPVMSLNLPRVKLTVPNQAHTPGPLSHCHGSALHTHLPVPHRRRAITHLQQP